MYFLAGDALSNGMMGVATAWLISGLISPAWHMLFAMFAGMVAGMILSLLMMPVFVALFGAMEVMLPVMLTAMLAGMVFGMLAAMHTLTASEILLGGGLSGILVLLITYIADTRFHGKTS